jgi:type I restriction enzyme S subunit
MIAAEPRPTSVALGSACEVNPPRPSLSGRSDDTPVVFVPMAAVDDVTGEIASPEPRRLGDVRDKSYRTFTSNDVLFAKITPCMENGKCAVVPEIEGGLGFGSTEFHVLRTRPGVSPRFIWHLLRQKSFRRLAEEHMSGSVGQLRVPADFLRDVPIYLPPRECQDRIVESLDATTRAARSAEERLTSAKRAVERLRLAILRAACTGSLTADWREPSREPSPEIPDGWIRMPLGQIAERVTKGTTPTSYGHAFTSSGIAFIKVENLRDGRIVRESITSYISDGTNQTQARSVLREGDILFSIAGTIGRTAIIRGEDLPANTNQALSIVRGTGHLLIPEYLVIALQSAVQDAAADAARGSGMNNISLGDVRGFDVAVPPRPEQYEIVRRVDQLLKLSNELRERIDTIERVVARSSEAVLAKAFLGELVFAKAGGTSVDSKPSRIA